MSANKKRTSLSKRVIFSLVILVLCLELGLQIAHRAAMKFGRDSKLIHPGAPVVLCLGDSHTYGTSIPENESYPSQLQALLDKNNLPANVINRGIPGQNSSELRRSLPEILARWKPALVIVLIGANNDWNRMDTEWSDITDGAGDSGIISRIEIYSSQAARQIRVARLLTYVWNEHLRKVKAKEREVGRDGKAYFHVSRLGTQDWNSSAELADRTSRDLTAIVDLIRQSGAEVIFLNYPAQPFAPYDLGNSFIANAARTRSVPLVDVAAAIKPLFWKSDDNIDWDERDRLFLKDRTETHLAGPGYAIVANELFNTIVKMNLLGQGEQKN